MYVPHRVEAVEVKAETSDPNSVLTVNGAPTASGQESGPVGLQVGRNLICIEGQSQEARSTYEVKVIRAHPTPSWVKLKERCPWVPRDSAGELVFKDRMWLFGGYTPGLIADVWSSADGTEWTKVGEIPS